MKWQTIESAPKDGKAVLVFYKNELGNGRTVKANFVKQFTDESCDDDWYETDEEGNCFTPEGWYEIIDNWNDYSAVHINYEPTHWTPLPNPPTE